MEDVDASMRRGLKGRRRRLTLLAPVAAVVALAALTPGNAMAASTGTITGTVNVPSGVAGTDVTATLLDPSGASVATATVTAGSASTSAVYTFSGVAAGQYEIYFSAHAADNVAAAYYSATVASGVYAIAAATPVTVTAGSTVTDQSTTLAAGATISGTVSDASEASNTTETVSACPLDSVMDVFYGDPEVGCKSAPVTEATGAYAVTSLPAGSYTLTYTLKGTDAALGAYQYSGFVTGSGLAPDQGQGSVFTVAAAGTEPANFSIPAIGGVAGTVTGPGGSAVKDFTVQLYSTVGVIDSGVVVTHTSGSDAFTLSALPGTYTLEVTDSEGLLLAPTFQSVTITAGQAAPVSVSLSRAGTITGTVRAARGGADLGGIPVTLVSSDAESVPLFALGQGTAQTLTTVTRSNGTYSLAGVPAGTWYVEFNGGLAYNGDAYSAQFYGGKPALAGAKEVVVASGATTTGISGDLLPASVTAIGAPKLSSESLSGLNTAKGSLRFRISAGANAGYVHSFFVNLPTGITFVTKNIKADLSLGGKAFTEKLKGNRLTVTFDSAQPSATLTIKAGGLTDTRAIEASAKAGKIKTETIHVTSTDTTGLASALSFVVKKPA